ncbi:hypothetical protein NOI20_03690 [Rhodobacteraceae bacterium 10Alg 79]|uniref:Uncharacterized protein n=2 Tax=Rhodalgimonas zhirmunskyi TaxID=2964767 RepID=A0AAJ1X6A6_9RHOB|nr:hypothetical protein [Rhodoalgimonas zhirmunskyi]MDQ2093202.1 hypothetical protein [Rhodoalgimonas zhirmunskyi]
MRTQGDSLDPKNLIREAYRIEGIGMEECRSIFVDWALSLPDTVEPQAACAELLERYGEEGHPMTAVLSEGMSTPARTGRRGGRRGRRA